MKTSTSETSMVALPSSFTDRTDEPNTSTSAEPKFSTEFVNEQLLLLINSPQASDELKEAAKTMLAEIEARQVRSIDQNVSSANMSSSSSLYCFSVSRTPSPSPPSTPSEKKETPTKQRRLRDRDIYRKKKKRELIRHKYKRKCCSPKTW